MYFLGLELPQMQRSGTKYLPGIGGRAAGGRQELTLALAFPSLNIIRKRISGPAGPLGALRAQWSFAFSGVMGLLSSRRE